MPDIKLTLIKGEKTDNRVDYRDLLPVNMVAVNRKILDADGYLLNYPGIELFSAGQGTDRGGVFNERFNQHFRISGTSLIEVDELGTVSVLGTVTGTGQASLPYSFNTQAIITDGKMFLYSPSGGFVQVTDADLGNPIDGIWIDGYYFLTDGEYIYHTDINDETAIDPLKFASAEFTPDPVLGVSKTQDNKVIVWGRHSIEYFVNVATPNFAFKRVETRAQKIGIVATHAKIESDGAFYIIGNRLNDALSAHRITVGNAEKIATREIDKILSEYTDTDLSDMRIEKRMEDGINLIIFHLPDYVLCFNETIAQAFGLDAAWSILKSGYLSDVPYRAINGIFDTRNAKWIYGDKTAINIGSLNDTLSTQYGDMAEWILYTPFIRFETASINEIEITTIPGYSIANDATVAVSMLYNGVTWGKETWMQYDTYLDYNKRFILRRLGNVNHYVAFKFRGVSRSRMAFGLFRVNYG